MSFSSRWKGLSGLEMTDWMEVKQIEELCKKLHMDARSTIGV
jgi:hypothetical protein